MFFFSIVVVVDMPRAVPTVRRIRFTNLTNSSLCLEDFLELL